MSKKGNNLDFWVELFNQHDLPIFSRTVQEILSVAEDSESSMSELVKVILQDSAMTAKVLKLANTAFYNPHNKTVSTVSRAVMLIGFDKVRAISLTVALVETVVRSKNRDRLLRELARSLHAATQARDIALELKDVSPEEVFVASLLYNIGELAFWCFARQEAEELSSELSKGGAKEDAEIKVLGFPLKKLSRRLVEEWKLNPLLEDALNPKKTKTRRLEIITLGHELAKSAENGWKSEAVAEAAQKISSLVNMPSLDLLERFYDNAHEAARISKDYGVGAVASIIPLPKVKKTTVVIDDTEDRAEEEFEEISKYDPVLQLNILRDMTALLFEKPDFHILLEMTLEGIYRGIGMDRTLFALIAPDKKHLKARYALGLQRDYLREHFNVSLTPGRPNLFKHVLENKNGIWMSPQKGELLDMLNPAIVEILGGSDFFAAPIIVNNQSIGLFYSDRIPSGRDLDQRSFENFEYFAQQASLGLDYINRLKR